MKENKKKLSLLTRLDDIVSDNCVNNKVSIYKFSSISMIIINDEVICIDNAFVKFTLQYDALMIEIYNDTIIREFWSYKNIQNINILLGDG